jgi:2-polyprenyl-3-methyl-5-hydroxy-6-metoxy-1,4-benzoquinol methylase
MLFHMRNVRRVHRKKMIAREDRRRRVTLWLVDPMKDVLEREREYHERLYSGKAQQRFAQAAVREFRRHLCEHILRTTGLGAGARVLSAGCGIGDQEIALAPRVGDVTGVDLSPSGIREARAAAAAAGVTNTTFVEGTLETAALPEQAFDLVIAIFFLHHLPEAALREMPRTAARLLRPGGWFLQPRPEPSAAFGRGGLGGHSLDHEAAPVAGRKTIGNEASGGAVRKSGVREPGGILRFCVHAAGGAVS